MQDFYLIDDGGIRKSDKENCNFEIYINASTEDKTNFLKQYHLPKGIFSFDDMPNITPRIQYLENEYLNKTCVLLISNVKQSKEFVPVEKRLESFTFILSNNRLFCFVHKLEKDESDFILNLSDKSISSLESVIIKTGIYSYKNFTKELDKQKSKIDELYNSAIDSTSNKVLIRVADTERDMVMLQHVINNQAIVFEDLLKDDGFTFNLSNDLLVYDIKWYNRQVKLFVEVYRDLLDATSSLFTDIMSNNLNQLMKVLSTISIIIASSTFVASLWGMNTGGLPFKNYKYGTLVMIIASLLLGFITYLYLKNKNYFNNKPNE